MKKLKNTIKEILQAALVYFVIRMAIQLVVLHPWSVIYFIDAFIIWPIIFGILFIIVVKLSEKHDAWYEERRNKKKYFPANFVFERLKENNLDIYNYYTYSGYEIMPDYWLHKTENKIDIIVFNCTVYNNHKRVLKVNQEICFDSAHKNFIINKMQNKIVLKDFYDNLFLEKCLEVKKMIDEGKIEEKIK